MHRSNQPAATSVQKKGAAAKASDGTGGYPAPATAHGHVARMLPSPAEEMSPRLMPLDDNAVVGPPLLPEPEEHSPEERFCMDFPIGTPGMPCRRTTAVTETALPFPVLVTRMESSIGQASLLLNDRLRTLHLRLQKMTFCDSQLDELCEIADGVVAAAYHLQKWACLLSPEEGLRKPTKPGHCEDKDEAFAAMHCAAPRIIVAAAGATKGLQKAIHANGEKAEAVVNGIGVPTEDIRALAPHLEALVFRLSRLNARIREPKKDPDVVEQYFAPVIGSTPLEILPQCLEAK